MANERIHYLYKLANSNGVVSPETCIREMETIAVRFDITLGKHIKRSYCKQCKYPYDKSVRIRIKNHILIITCSRCNSIRRLVISL
jgi:ribonuclease P protein subunit RPR2